MSPTDTRLVQKTLLRKGPEQRDFIANVGLTKLPPRILVAVLANSPGTAAKEAIAPGVYMHLRSLLRAHAMKEHAAIADDQTSLGHIVKRQWGNIDLMQCIVHSAHIGRTVSHAHRKFRVLQPMNALIMTLEFLQRMVQTIDINYVAADNFDFILTIVRGLPTKKADYELMADLLNMLLAEYNTRVSDWLTHCTSSAPSLKSVWYECPALQTELNLIIKGGMDNRRKPLDERWVGCATAVTITTQAHEGADTALTRQVATLAAEVKTLQKQKGSAPGPAPAPATKRARLTKAPSPAQPTVKQEKIPTPAPAPPAAAPAAAPAPGTRGRTTMAHADARALLLESMRTAKFPAAYDAWEPAEYRQHDFALVSAGGLDATGAPYCRRFILTGECKFGPSCRFSHAAFTGPSNT
jgi:hypothetical protein